MTVDLASLAKTIAASVDAGASASFVSGTTIRPSNVDCSATLPQTSRLPLVSLSRSPGSVDDVELELASLLGQGGMGAVWVAFQRSLEREVAVKVPRTGGNPLTTNALLKEARVAGNLEHPHIVPIHVLGVDPDGGPVLVMKRIEGQTLATLIEQEDHPAWPILVERHGDRDGAILEVLMRVADALQFAHSKGIVHRDVKPENVMVGLFGEVYLLDWGIAHRIGQPTTEIVGTPGFLAPEMLDPEVGQVDARTDVYLLGATLHAALTNTPRHLGSTLAEVFDAVLHSRPVEYESTVQPELAALCNSATQRDPMLRPASASVMHDTMATILRHQALAKLTADIEQRVGPTLALPPDPSRWRNLVEARFALLPLLREWTQNSAALELQIQVLNSLVRTEILRERPDDAAAALQELAELTDVDSELEVLVLECRRSIEERSRLVDLGRKEQKEAEVAPSFRGLVFLVALMGFSTIVILGGFHRLKDLNMWKVVVYDLVSLSLITLGVVWQRRSLLYNRRGREMVTGAFLMLFGTTAVDLFSALSGLLPEQGAPFTLLLMSSGLAGLGFLVSGANTVMRWSMRGAAIVVLTAGVVAIRYKTWAVSLVSFGTFVGMASALVWMAILARENRLERS